MSKLVYNGFDLSGCGCKRPFLFVEARRMKGNDAFVNDVLTELLQIVMETYPALAADTTYVIAAVQAALQFARGILERTKK